MKLLVGLGNPGAEYSRHRHNIGFMALDEIASQINAGPWRAKFQAEIAEARLGPDKLLLIKPQTYMNKSGQSVGEALRFYKLAAEDVIVFYDELDLEPFKVKARLGGGAAGHNGIRSLIAHLGEAFWRVRLGIGHPGDKSRVHGYVLGNFAKSEEAALDDLLRDIPHVLGPLVAGDGPRFLTDLAQRRTPNVAKTKAHGPKAKSETRQNHVDTKKPATPTTSQNMGPMAAALAALKPTDKG